MVDAVLSFILIYSQCQYHLKHDEYYIKASKTETAGLCQIPCWLSAAEKQNHLAACSPGISVINNKTPHSFTSNKPRIECLSYFIKKFKM